MTKLIIPKKIHNKYTYLLNRFKDLEWSGPAWYRVKTDKDGLTICFGTCNHVYHLDCIQNWLNTRNTCPLCNIEWETSKIELIYDSVSE